LTTHSDWEKAVLKGSEDSQLSVLESPVEGSKTTYPLLGSELAPPGHDLARFDWRVRVVVNEPIDVQTMSDLADSEIEVLEAQELAELPLESSLQAFKTEVEGRVKVDLHLLKNITEIRRLKGQNPDLKDWALVCEGHSEEDPEALVGETLRLLTGVLSGCQVLEIRQGEGESLRSVKTRVNIARLMAHESSLQSLPDPIAGAGFFQELTERL
jgi:hypothetical protein